MKEARNGKLRGRPLPFRIELEEEKKRHPLLENGSSYLRETKRKKGKRARGKGKGRSRDESDSGKGDRVRMRGEDCKQKKRKPAFTRGLYLCPFE